MTEERKNKILEIIGENGYIKVEQLAQKLYTSSSTVRRNLTQLEKLGLVKRSYGGATLSSDSLERPLNFRFQKNHEQKSIIAQKASKFLRDNTVIFIDSSSTCLHMLPYISNHRNITVYTDGLELCALLGENNVKVYCLGGAYLPRSKAFYGEYAENVVGSLYFDTLFFSASGFCDNTITDVSEPSSPLRRKLVKNSKEKYFLCDSSKIGKKDTYVICGKNEITKVITETELL